MDQDATWYGGRPRPRRLCVRCGPRSPPQKGACLLWPNGWMDQDGTWHGDKSQPRGHSPLPNFWPISIVAKRLDGCIKLPLGMDVDLSPGDLVIDGDPIPCPKSGRSLPPQKKKFGHVYCDQTAGCIKMPLGTEVDISPGDFVLDETPLPLSKRGRSPTIFSPCLLRPNGCMDQDATWYGARSRPRRHCVRWGPSSPPQKGGEALFPNFWPVSIVAKRLDGSRWHLAWTWALVQTTLC